MKKTFIHLTTENTSYVLYINDFLHLENLYYGARLNENEDLKALINKQKNLMGTATNYDAATTSTYSLNYINLEVGTIGKGDYRKPSIILRHDKGYVSDFIVKEHSEAPLNSLATNEIPIPHGASKYYFVILEDKVSGAVIKLDYLLFNRANVIARRVVVLSGKVSLEKIASMNLDLNNNHYEIYSTYGTWGNEGHNVRHKIVPGIFELSTNAGPSSNRHNPFFLVLGKSTTLDYGEGYGVNLIYSGPFKATVERTFDNRLRIQHGINDETFRKPLKENEAFITPFAILTYSNIGENGISQNFHTFVSDHVVREAYSKKVRPILLNNWEATYFDFTTSKLKSLMEDASKLGIELFVLDDGWFIKRDDDFGGLGNYEVNTKKLPGGLKRLSNYAKKLGMKFGLWFEPEMVSEDHEIFSKHPDWVIQIPGVTPSVGRFQYALNLALPAVQEYIITNVARTLESADITYVKWDYNRNLSDFYSVNSAIDTFFYDYTLGLYKILKSLTDKFPNILWEGCASGGNRFDLGTLSFFDQMWMSDCSDAFERIRMHTTFAKAYPLGVMSGHVSASPNHQMLRELPLQTRFNNAFMSGGFGYELDVTNLTPKAKKELIEYNKVAKVYQHIVTNGTYYELLNASQKDKKGYALVSETNDAAVVLISEGVSSILPEVSKLPALPMLIDGTYEVITLNQSTDIYLFGSLLNRVIPKFIKYDGPIINYLNKRKSAEELIKTEIREEYTVSANMLRAGALTLYPDWTATGVENTTRLARDFTSILYFITKKPD